MTLAGKLIYLAALTLIAIGCSACMQVTGASEIDLWGAKFKANSGFDVSAGVMQYTDSDNRRSTNTTNHGGASGR